MNVGKKKKILLNENENDSSGGNKDQKQAFSSSQDMFSLFLADVNKTERKKDLRQTRNKEFVVKNNKISTLERVIEQSSTKCVSKFIQR